jgi:hypothetical protein
MTTSSHHRQATESEIISLPAAERHDANMSTNVESIHHAASRTSSRPRTAADEEKNSPVAMEKDLEKGEDAESSASTDQPEEVTNPNIVDFDGVDDTENPMDWRMSKKWGMISLVSAITFLTPLASSMFAPGVPDVMREFNSTSEMLEGFMLSVYVLGVSWIHDVQRHEMLTLTQFAFGPLSKDQ